ncbi:rhodanese-like domain-containing protein [Streptacidiphilus sp. EB129]|uniref:rhodanese-like domain-containing protein n=1 Tax=Streptacidiphilus sp. EB129 TaxID=3156262 RepID=UPI003519D06E
MTANTTTAAHTAGAVLGVAPAAPAEAAAHFAARLAFEADVSDVHADLASGAPGIVVVDSRSAASWAQGRIPGAIHIPTAQIAELAPTLVDPSLTVVTYCWGPGCNGATRAALAFARLGYSVKEMLGGYEYWVREGFDTLAGTTSVTNPIDPLTAPSSGIACAC